MTRPQVLVYRYQYWDEESMHLKESKVFATITAIHNGLGIPLYGSERAVFSDEVTEGGIHVPPETSPA